MPRLWNRIVDILFGCPHARYSWPISVIDRERVEPYVRCSDCGERLPFDTGEWRVIRGVRYEDWVAERETRREEKRQAVVFRPRLRSRRDGVGGGGSIRIMLAD